MTSSSYPGPERQGVDTAVPGWYPNRAALGGCAWWTGRAWGWPFSGPADRPGPPPSGLAAAEPRWPAWQAWLLWLAVAYWSALGGAAVCTIIGMCLVTGRPADDATPALRGAMLFMNVVLWLSGTAMARGKRTRAMRSGLNPCEAGPPPGLRAGRLLLTSLPVWVYCLSLLLSLAALVASVSHAESGWWIQMCLATVVAGQFAALGARSFRAYRDARPQGVAPDGPGPARCLSGWHAWLPPDGGGDK
jgi:hypothetical protein